MKVCVDEVVRDRLGLVDNMLGAGETGRRKNLSDSDRGQMFTTRRLGQSISEHDSA